MKRQAMKLQIRFWWSGYSPEESLKSFDPAVIEMPFEVSQDGGRTWRPPLNGAALQTVYDWMVEHSLGVVDTALVGQRRRGRWEGQYILTIGRIH